MPKLKIIDKTPASLGYSMPAEWALHRGTWISWPRPEGISFPERYHTIGGQMANLVGAIAAHEEVHINVPNFNWERIVRVLFKDYRIDVGRVFFHYIKTNENWCRDHGPAFVQKTVGGKKRTAVVDWGFNAWGGKYPPHNDDDNVPTRIAEQWRLPVFYPDIIMEGGAVDFNGAGTILTTTDCLLNKNRNPGLSKTQIEQYLKDYYGQSHICWLTGGIDGDDTDGHVDDLARFINPTTIVIAIEDDPRDINYKVLKSARKQMDKLRDQAGNPFNIIEIPMPGNIEIEGEKVPATYVNFYFVNEALLVPTYGNKKRDQQALSILQKALPDRKVIGIDCTNIIWGLGAIHCLTQQIPWMK